METKPQRTVVFDAETDNLLMDVRTCWCISTYCIEDKEAKHFGPHEIVSALKYLCTATTLIGHNIANFDLPMLKKLYSFELGKNVKIVDTMLLDCILYPEEKVHSLDGLARRFRLKQQKVGHEDWSKYSEEMKWRCDSDVIINTKVYEELISKDGAEECIDALELEQEVSWIHAHQVVKGVRIDIHKGIALYKQLDTELKSLAKEIAGDIPDSLSCPTVSKKKIEELRSENIREDGFISLDKVLLGVNALKKDGKPNANNIKYFGDEKPAQGPYNRIEFTPFNLNSPVQVTKYLLSIGWVPTEWNFVKDKESGEFRKTGPKLTEDSYNSLPEGIGKMIGHYNMLKHRRSMLLSIRKKDGEPTGILASAWKRGDKRMSSDAFTCGTNTGRYRHFGLANVPRPGTPYGKELREIFMVSKGCYMLGIDLSGIEAVVLAHYCKNYVGGDALVKEILKGDFHQANADMWGVDRNTAKSVLYALMYGASPKKLASIADKHESEGKSIKEDFFLAYPAIKTLVDNLSKAFKQTGAYIRTLDGRRTYVREGYKLLNTLIQSTAAQIFKRWMLKVDGMKPEWAEQIIAYHDELQFECRANGVEVELFGQRVCKVAEEVGKEMGVTVLVTAEHKVGKNWRDCH